MAEQVSGQKAYTLWGLLKRDGEYDGVCKREVLMDKYELDRKLKKGRIMCAVFIGSVVLITVLRVVFSI